MDKGLFMNKANSLQEELVALDAFMNSESYKKLSDEEKHWITQYRNGVSTNYYTAKVLTVVMKDHSVPMTLTEVGIHFKSVAESLGCHEIAEIATSRPGVSIEFELNLPRYSQHEVLHKLTDLFDCDGFQVNPLIDRYKIYVKGMRK